MEMNSHLPEVRHVAPGYGGTRMSGESPSFHLINTTRVKYVCMCLRTFTCMYVYVSIDMLIGRGCSLKGDLMRRYFQGSM